MSPFIDGSSDKLRDIDDALIHDDNHSAQRCRGGLSPIRDDEVGGETCPQAGDYLSHDESSPCGDASLNGRSDHGTDTGEEKSPLSSKVTSEGARDGGGNTGCTQRNTPDGGLLDCTQVVGFQGRVVEAKVLVIPEDGVRSESKGTLERQALRNVGKEEREVPRHGQKPTSFSTVQSIKHRNKTDEHAIPNDSFVATFVLHGG